MEPVDSKHLHLGKADLITLVIILAIVLLLSGVLLVVLF